MNKIAGICLSCMLAFCNPVQACEHENVYVVDLEFSEFIGKVMGVQYQCMDKVNNKYKLYNRGLENKAIYLGEDSRFMIMEVGGKETLTLFKGVSDGNEFYSNK